MSSYVLGEFVYVCFHCGYFSEELIILRRHIKRKHIKKERFFKLPIKKIRIPVNKKKFKGKICPHCDYCPRSNTSVAHANSLLKRHIKEVHCTAKKDTYSCKECDYKTRRHCELKFHTMAKHCNKETLPISCHLCLYRTYRKSLLKCHLFCKHSIGDVCTRHKSAKRQNVIIECGLCDYVTTSNHNYKSHYSYCHAKDKPFKCSHCSHRATKLGDLRSHISSVHTKMKSRVCPHCDYCTNKSSHLQSHVRRKHTREKPYACPYCKFAGFVPGDLKRHIANKHKGEGRTEEFMIEIKEEPL